MWLKDFLPDQLPKARILLFGYNANVAITPSTAGVDEQAVNLLNRLKFLRSKKYNVEIDRPIMFICYSLGGLIVKRALSEADLDSTYLSIRKYCYGIVFFGTPHRGGNFAGLLGKSVNISHPNDFMKALEKCSPIGHALVKNFRHQHEDRWVVTFYETLPVRDIGIIVDLNSAILGLSGKREIKVALDADHEGLCQFEDCDGDDYEQVAENIQDLAEKVLKTKLDKNGEKCSLVLKWLYPYAFDKKHMEINGRRQKNTGKWILEAPPFRNWTRRPSNYRLLWGHGIPGAGKTFMSSFVIDYLQGQASKIRHGIAYIYFEYQEQDQQTPRNVLASLIRQLIEQLPRFELPENIEDLHDKLEHTTKKPTVEELYAALIATSKSFVETFIVCDALDECHQKKQRMHLLPLFHQMGRDGINLFLTSREHPEDIQRSFHDSAKIELSAKTEDIRIYIQQKIDEDCRTKRLAEKGNCKEKIISELEDCAEGMFLLIHFYVKSLYRQPTAGKLLENLERCRGSSAKESPLDHTYDSAIESILGPALEQHRGDAELAAKIFSWLVNARRTLTVPEIQIAVSIEQGRYELDKKSDVPDPQTLLEVCGGLVTIDQKSNTIRLAHYTVQEYLRRKSIVPEDADILLAVACTTFLSFNVFSEGACKSAKRAEKRYRAYPFIGYAACHLSSHLRACDESATTEAVLRFLGRPGNISSYMQALHVLSTNLRLGDFYDHPQNRLPLHIASEIGHHKAVAILLGSVDISASDSHGFTALHLAAREGHEAIVKSLIDKGANVSAATTMDMEPLHFAAEIGNVAIIQLLLGNGADILVRDIIGRTALLVAAAGGYEAAVHVLLQHGARVSIPDYGNQTALFQAAAKGHDEIVQLLLQYGAEISTRDIAGRTALLVATEGGHEVIVQLLLGKGADVSTCDKRGRTLLLAAVIEGHESIVRLLLDNGVENGARDKYGRSTLHLATEMGNEAMVRLLIVNGAEVSASDNQMRTSLHAAAGAGNTSIAKLLLDHGADVSARDIIGQTALSIAIIEGNEAIVRLLLKNGAWVQARDDMGRTALFTAATEGNNKMVQFLLQEGAEISACDNRGRTAIFEAAAKGHHKTVQLLLKNGAQVSKRDKYEKTALFRAAHKGHIETVELLLKNNADISTRDRWGQTALFEAARGGHIRTAQLLLENGSSILARDGYGRTALFEAASQGHVKTILFLLESGAELSTRDHYGETVLFEAARGGHTAAVRLLLKEGAEISPQNKKGKTALFVAATSERQEPVQILLKNGVDTLIRDDDGETALDHAVYRQGTFGAWGIIEEVMNEQMEVEKSAEEESRDEMNIDMCDSKERSDSEEWSESEKNESKHEDEMEEDGLEVDELEVDELGVDELEVSESEEDEVEVDELEIDESEVRYFGGGKAGGGKTRGGQVTVRR